MSTGPRTHPRRWLVTVLLAVGSSALVEPHAAAQRGDTAPAIVVATGCVAQHPDTATAPPTGHEQGSAQGLHLTRATMQPGNARNASAPPRSAVPGSLPSGTNSGTTPEAPAVKTQGPIEQSFWLVGPKTPELIRALDKRVEVTGTLDERLASNPGAPRVTDAGAAAARRSTSAPPDPSASAHPSAPTRAIAVDSFRVIGERCS